MGDPEQRSTSLARLIVVQERGHGASRALLGHFVTAMHRTGLSSGTLAKRYGCYPSTVKRWYLAGGPQGGAIRIRVVSHAFQIGNVMHHTKLAPSGAGLSPVGLRVMNTALDWLNDLSKKVPEVARGYRFLPPMPEIVRAIEHGLTTWYGFAGETVRQWKTVGCRRHWQAEARTAFARIAILEGYKVGEVATYLECDHSTVSYYVHGKAVR